MKKIKVVAAVIMNNGKIFATQRGYGEFKDGWEFPGGKIEPGESPEEALVREIREELHARVRVGKNLCTVEYDYPKFHLSMQCFLCALESESIVLSEHEDARWLDMDDLNSVDWLPADIEVVKELKSLYAKG